MLFLQWLTRIGKRQHFFGGGILSARRTTIVPRKADAVVSHASLWSVLRRTRRLAHFLHRDSPQNSLRPRLYLFVFRKPAASSGYLRNLPQRFRRQRSVLIWDAADPAKARAFLDNPDLREGQGKGGIIDGSLVHFL